MLLAIDTASNETSIALLEGSKIVAEKSWESTYNEAEKLLPEIIDLVSDLKKITGIMAVSGPGSFTGLRVGITVANTLAFLLGVKLYSIDTFTIWRHRGPKDATLLIKAGKTEVFLNEKVVNIEKAATKLKRQKVYGDLLLEQKPKFNLIQPEKSFALAVLELTLPKPVKIIKPDYRRKPKITISKDKWKKCSI